MGLYARYKNEEEKIEEKKLPEKQAEIILKNPELNEQIIEIAKISALLSKEKNINGPAQENLHHSLPMETQVA